MDRSHPGVQIRVPATANLMLDSTDRTTGTPDNFVISKNNSILNGFFNRIAATEVVLDWGIPNISAQFNNNTFSVTVSSVVYTVTLANGFYNVNRCLDRLIEALNVAVPGAPFSITDNNPGVYLVSTGSFTADLTTKLAQQLNLVASTTPTGYQIVNPDLRPYSYLDFISSQLTYNQELKDATTAPSDKNVLVRWYFAFDDVGSVNPDGYGFPNLMGYSQFINRRAYNYPKQIRWNSAQPVGQLGFEVYGSDDRLISSSFTFSSTSSNNQMDWLMTLQVSEN